jgi:V-type H+-transporting ATPase proteolipid subunit
MLVFVGLSQLASAPAALFRLSRSIIFCEAVAIYGVIVAIILQTKLESVTREQGLYSKGNMAAGYAIFGAGLTCGFSNLVCG